MPNKCIFDVGNPNVCIMFYIDYTACWITSSYFLKIMLNNEWYNIDSLNNNSDSFYSAIRETWINKLGRTVSKSYCKNHYNCVSVFNNTLLIAISITICYPCFLMSGVDLITIYYCYIISSICEIMLYIHHQQVKTSILESIRTKGKVCWTTLFMLFLRLPDRFLNSLDFLFYTNLILN